MKNSLSTKGLSLSQAQSISNLCNQKALDISNKLSDLNNVSKTLKLGEETYVETQPKVIPENVVDLLLEKGRLHATQAFLMENIKAKKELIDSIKSDYFYEDESGVSLPEMGEFKQVELLPSVNEDFGLNQLTVSEYNEYIECEAYASHIGQFIHKNGTLDKLRKELPSIKTLEWIEVEEGKKTPLLVNIHHTPEQLLEVHNTLATLHRKYEQRVNYYKAKIKDATTLENARIANINADLISEANAHNNVIKSKYHNEIDEYNNKIKELSAAFEANRQLRIKEASGLRIEVDSRFQSVIDEFLKDLD